MLGHHGVCGEVEGVWGGGPMLVAGFETGVLGKSWYERIYQNENGLIAASAYDALPDDMSDDPVLLINSVIEMINRSNDTSFYDDLFLTPINSTNSDVSQQELEQK
jgi:hypothetical protein